MKRFDMGVSLAVCFAAMILGAVAHAEGAYVWGIGSTSCGEFTAISGKRTKACSVRFPFCREARPPRLGIACDPFGSEFSHQ